jgi:hypothetical protein
VPCAHFTEPVDLRAEVSRFVVGHPRKLRERIDVGYEAKVLADSVTPSGVRLLTVQATFPRFILAEINTHRVFSRNSASSRAIPPEKLIEKVKIDPFIPETFNARVKGMGVGEVLDLANSNTARRIWLEGRDAAVQNAEKLMSYNIDKSRINRLLEPFMWHTAIITATEWDNFFALRSPPGDVVDPNFPAQLEFQRVAIEMRKVMRASIPVKMTATDWHMPLVGQEEFDAWARVHLHLSQAEWMNYWAMISAGRCARVSFDTHENFEPLEDSFERARGLLQNGHMSPFEHQARPVVPEDEHWMDSNLRGWTQFRKTIGYEENRVGFLDRRESWYA